ncbi:serine O-acetyltransferase [Treponema sp.]|uniref:serine O-acetyltransferase n=1 Tax=Treponema sp. TaxID=166 RepID=UPI003F0D62E7
MEGFPDESVQNVINLILEDYKDSKAINRTELFNQTDKDEIIGIVKKLMRILFPGYYSDKLYKKISLKNKIPSAVEDVIYHLKTQIKLILDYCSCYPEFSDEEVDRKSAELTLSFIKKIPEIRAVLETDVQAAFEGDPAAYSNDEIILAYPGFYAIAVYRLAHELHLLKIPLLPRIMTEYAHSVTGIDIHPGAEIGKYFFMDHGTGIVIGETCIIGEHVKLYQGVTLGGLSTKGGQSLKGVQRHPTLKDNVTIYSGASILGGQTIIEENVIVGGNTFITSSVEKGKRVSSKKPELQIK